MSIVSLRDGLSLYGGGVVSIVGAGGKTTLMFRLAKELAAEGERVMTTTTTKIFMPTSAQSPSVILASGPDDILRKISAVHPIPLHVTAAARQDPATGKLIGFPADTIQAIWESRRFDWILVEADGAAHRPLKAPAVHEPVIPGCTQCLVAVIGLDAVGNPLNDTWVFRPELYAGLTGISLGSPVTPESVSTALLHRAGIMKGCPMDAKRFVFLNKADNKEHQRTGERIAEALLTKNPGALSGILIGSAADPEAAMEYFVFVGA